MSCPRKVVALVVVRQELVERVRLRGLGLEVPEQEGADRVSVLQTNSRWIAGIRYSRLWMAVSISSMLRGVWKDMLYLSVRLAEGQAIVSSSMATTVS